MMFGFNIWVVIAPYGMSLLVNGTSSSLDDRLGILIWRVHHLYGSTYQSEMTEENAQICTLIVEPDRSASLESDARFVMY